MNLIEEAVIIELFGIRMYAFGVYVTLGALLAVAVFAIAGRNLSMKAGSVPLTVLLSSVCGILMSRICFCLMNRELGGITPLSYWPQLNGGGWSMVGLICGVFLGGYISAKITGEKAGRILDLLSLSILPLMAAERIGESRIEDFDISRPLDSTFLSGSFLALGEDEPVLATYYIAAATAIVLFTVLVFRFSRREREGNLTIAFLLMYGASSIITESLRYDRFLSISFVGLQQVSAAIILALGVFLAVKRSNRPKSFLASAAMISIPLTICIVISLEFALDRTTWNKILIYTAMIIAVCIPAGMGLKLLNISRKGNEAV